MKPTTETRGEAAQKKGAVRIQEEDNSIFEAVEARVQIKEAVITIFTPEWSVCYSSATVLRIRNCKIIKSSLWTSPAVYILTGNSDNPSLGEDDRPITLTFSNIALIIVK